MNKINPTLKYVTNNIINLNKKLTKWLIIITSIFTLINHFRVFMMDKDTEIIETYEQSYIKIKENFKNNKKLFIIDSLIFNNLLFFLNDILLILTIENIVETFFIFIITHLILNPIKLKILIILILEIFKYILFYHIINIYLHNVKKKYAYVSNVNKKLRDNKILITTINKDDEYNETYWRKLKELQLNYIQQINKNYNNKTQPNKITIIQQLELFETLIPIDIINSNDVFKVVYTTLQENLNNIKNINFSTIKEIYPQILKEDFEYIKKLIIQEKNASVLYNLLL
jgi:hypothetical protein